MKTIIRIMLILVILLNFACKKEKFGDGFAENIPVSVNLGESQIFINGEEVFFNPDFVFRDKIQLFFGNFFHTKNEITDDLVLGIDSLRLGDFDPIFSFHRAKGDGTFEGYKQIDKDSAFLIVTSLDTLNKEVQGRFEARFQKTSSVISFKKKYPEKLLIQGVFNEKYHLPF
jgi:hypothetical protein